jgi:type IVB pilus formation R64 PilN family outer membrane protein
MNELVPFKASPQKFILPLKNERHTFFQYIQLHNFEFFRNFNSFIFANFASKSLKFATYFLFVFMLFSCATKQHADKKTEEYASELNKTISTSNVTVTESPYIGATPVDYTRDYTKHPIFSAQSSLNMRGTLEEVSTTIGQLLDISVQVENEAAETAKSIVQTVNFEGKALALLDYISTLFGVAWTYDQRSNALVFSRMQIRTFAILAAPGALSHASQMSSSSSQGEGGTQGTGGETYSGTSSSINEGSSSDTSQSLDATYDVDVWSDIEKGVMTLLSPAGTQTLNRSAGSITVRDTVSAMRQISAYIDSINDAMLKQVALSVKVWSVEVNNDLDVGLNLSLLFDDSFKLTTGASALSGLDLSSLTATIVDGSLKDSSATLKALNTLGKATQVTSGSGVIMNNQPLPVQNVKRQSYLGSVSSFTPSTGGNTSALQPSQVTYGFAMTVIPNILDRRRCVLQYNVSLSNLDRLEEVRSGTNSIQLPTVSMRSFNQRAFMNMGQTLVLAGFEQEREQNSSSAGLLSFGNKRNYGKSLIVITITVQSMNG